MRHRKASLKLSRTTSHRIAMFRNMVTSLFKYERIRTTGVKAKELRRWAEHLITLAKRGDLHARRQALTIIREKGVVHKLFDEANEKFGNSNGGYTRIVKLGRRAGDAAPMSLVELIVPGAGGKKKAKKKTAKVAAGKKRSEAEVKEEMKPPREKEKKAKARKQPAEKKKAAGEKKEKTSIKQTLPKKKTESEKAKTKAK
jgi:large subunit ribosomal protein L17